MPTALFDNLSRGSPLKRPFNPPFTAWIPPQLPTGICSAQAATAKSLGFDGTVINHLSPATVSAGTFTTSALTLTQTGAFAGYRWRSGDVFRAVSGTGVVAGWYEIAAKVSDDTIRLAVDIGTPTSNPTNVIGQISGKAVLPFAVPIHFIFSQVADAGVITVEGIDQFGDAISAIITKVAGALPTQKVLSQVGGQAIPAFSRIDRISMAMTVVTGTVSCGWDYTTVAANAIALPFKAKGVPTAALACYMEDVSGIWTLGPFPSVLSNGSTAAADTERGVMRLAMGSATAVASTAATWTDATRTLTKAGAFTDFTFYPGATVTITGGTGVTAGTYVIQSKTSNDAVVLAESISGPLAVASAAFDTSTFTLTLAGAFTNYVWAAGDTFQATAGTDVVPGSYPIASRTDADNIVLFGDIGAPTVDPTDVDGLVFGSVNSADVAFSLTGAPSRWSRVQILVDPQQLVSL